MGHATSPTLRTEAGGIDTVISANEGVSPRSPVYICAGLEERLRVVATSISTLLEEGEVSATGSSTFVGRDAHPHSRPINADASKTLLIRLTLDRLTKQFPKLISRFEVVQAQIRSEPKSGADDWSLHCYVKHKSVVVVVYGKVAIARFQRDRITVPVLKRALHLPIDVGAKAEATDIRLAMESESVPESDIAGHANNGVDPGLAAAGLPYGERASNGQIRIDVPEPSAGQNVQGRGAVVDDPIGAAEGPHHRVDVCFGRKKSQRAGRRAVGLESQVYEVGEKSVAAIARLTGKHDRRGRPIDVVENLAEIDVDIDRRQAPDADPALHACHPEIGLCREGPGRCGFSRHGCGFRKLRRSVRSDRRHRKQRCRCSRRSQHQSSDDSHIEVPSNSVSYFMSDAIVLRARSDNIYVFALLS
ncbi:hypothetical protein BQ8794_220059 [Mesorhizobium prunaredense]|uniref:Uncharacterized protein n=1 Tax=Mesorhizobium prunaredense TaxID=1631249 RepID=A0A1R3V6F2_9HYPH|nr:hypothetical protein BQ8794_220059 [Mesorhizobium prunaredense]